MKRIPQLDGLRGIAVLMVFFHHALKVPLFWSGVDLFFVLSGYLITGILLNLKDKRETEGYGKTFYLRRARRILPPYVGFMLFLVLFIPVPWSQIWYWYTFFGANLANALDRVHVSAMMPLWSLAVEEQFYFVWPWVVLLCSRRTLRWIALTMLVAVPILRALCSPLFSDAGVIYQLTPFRADLLAAGALVAICQRDDAAWLQRNRRWSLWTLLAATGLLVALTPWPGFHHTANTIWFNIFGYSLVVAVFGSSLIQALQVGDGLGGRFLRSWPLRYMGKISYTFYLYQIPFLESIGRHVPSRIATTVLGFAATAIFSTLSWRFLESPILHWGRAASRQDRELAGVGGSKSAT